MINQASIQAVNDARWNEHFIKPLYDSYCFSLLPALIQSLFSGSAANQDESRELQTRLLGPLAGQYDRVVLFFIDAFGWRFFDKYADHYPFLSRFLNEGCVTKLTSQFPSTTAAHVTTIHTGLRVDASGVFEWFYYEPILDAMIAPLLFSFAADNERNTLLDAGVQPIDIFPFPGRTIYNDLGTSGVQSYVFGNAMFTPSPHGDMAFQGSQVVPYGTLRDGLSVMSSTMKENATPAYYFLYFEGIDSIGHQYGPSSLEFDAAVDSTMRLLEEFLASVSNDPGGRTLILVTADHGQTEMDPATTIYIDRVLPSFEQLIKRNRKGQLLVPGGSARDMFLYIEDEHLQDALGMLRKELEGRAEVYPTGELIWQGFFGSEPSRRLLDRVGNLVVLPYEGESVFWYGGGVFAQPFKGHHGGLTRPEMETILLAFST